MPAALRFQLAAALSVERVAFSFLPGGRGGEKDLIMSDNSGSATFFAAFAFAAATFSLATEIGRAHV